MVADRQRPAGHYEVTIWATRLPE